MLKKILVSIILIVCTFPLSVQALDNTFNDVDEETSYNEAINWMVDEGVIEGYEDGSFKPEQCVNRVEFLKMLYRTLDINETRYFGEQFSDTKTDEWYAEYILAARQRETIEGYEDGTFKPEQCVNRVEAIKMAVLEFNYGEIPEFKSLGSSEYLDVDQDSWYFQYFDYVISTNLLGLDHVMQSEFLPGEDMSRQEVAELLYRMKSIKDNKSDVYAEGEAPIAAGYIPGELKEVTFEELGISFEYPVEWGELIGEGGVRVDGENTNYKFLARLNYYPFDMMGRGGAWPDIFKTIEDIEVENYCSEYENHKFVSAKGCSLFESDNGKQGMRFEDFKLSLPQPDEDREYKTYLYVYEHPWEWKTAIGINDFDFISKNYKYYHEDQLEELVKSIKFIEQPEYMLGSELMDIDSFEIIYPNGVSNKHYSKIFASLDSSCEMTANSELNIEGNEIFVALNKRQFNEECTGSISSRELYYDPFYKINQENLESGEYIIHINNMVSDTFVVE